MAGCLWTCRRAHPMASVATWTATSGPLPDGREKATTGCTCSRTTASSLARFVFRKRAQTSVLAAPRETDCSWPQASLSTRCSSRPRAPRCLDQVLASARWAILRLVFLDVLRRQKELLKKLAVSRLNPPAIDDIALIGNRRAVVCSEEKNETGHLFRKNHSLQSLTGQDFGLVGFCKPKLLLSFGKNGARHNTIHSNAVRAKLMSKRARHPNNRSFRRNVHGDSYGRNYPADRTRINDGTSADLFHRRNHSLSKKELVFEVVCHRLVPEV